jgi:hypothetical protein
MQDGRPSTTALTAAALRAHHYAFAQEPRVLNDNLAARLAGLASQDDVRAHIDGMVEGLAAFGDRSAAEAVVRHVMLIVCARSRVVEDQSCRRSMLLRAFPRAVSWRWTSSLPPTGVKATARPKACGRYSTGSSATARDLTDAFPRM